MTKTVVSVDVTGNGYG